MNYFDKQPPNLTAEEQKEFAELRRKMFGDAVAIPIFKQELNQNVDGRRFVQLVEKLEKVSEFLNNIKRMMVMN